MAHPSGPRDPRVQWTTSPPRRRRERDCPLASTAEAGELLVTLAAAEAAEYAVDGLERRTLEVRCRHEPVDAVVIKP